MFLADYSEPNPHNVNQSGIQIVVAEGKAINILKPIFTATTLAQWIVKSSFFVNS